MIRGADLVMMALRDAGVRYLFTLSGNQIMSLYDASIDYGIRLIHVRHEGAAIHMADAWARLTGEVGLALVTAGPGHANALSALYTAKAAESPVVLLSGHAPLSQLKKGAFQELDQVELATPLAKAAWRVEDAARLLAEIAEAIRIATSGRPGPVHLSLPADVLEANVENFSVMPAYSSNVASGSLTLNKKITTRMLRLLSDAERPLILTGPMLCTPHGREVAETLDKALNVPVIGMESPRGINDPSLGQFSKVLGCADCILLLGKRIDYTLGFAEPPVIDPKCKLFSLSPDTALGNPNSSSARHVDVLSPSAWIDPYAAAQALASIADMRGCAKGNWYASVKKAIAWRPEAANGRRSPDGSIHPAQLCHEVQAALREYPNAILVSDGGEFCQWAQATISAPRRIINGPSGAIGCALPFAIAARLVEPNAPIVAMTGDGALGFHIAEFDTALRYALPIVVIVGNDARWNAEYQLQLRKYGSSRLVGCELMPTRYERVVEALGGYGEYVGHVDGLRSAFRRALDGKCPACINVSIDGVPAPTA